MKKILLYNLLFFAVISTMMVACKEEISLSNPLDRDFISIAELRDRYQGEPITLTSGNSSRHLFVSGVVLSHPAGNNVPEGKVIIQNGTGEQLRGITLSVEDLYTRYLQGDSIIVKIEGATLERVDGALQISGLTSAEIGRISTGNEQAVHLVTDDLGLLVAGRDIYENTLVSLLDVDVLGVVRDQVFGRGDVTLSDGTNTVLIKTMENANIAENLVPLEGNFRGIVSYTVTGEPYLSLRLPADIEGTRYMGPEFYTTFPETFDANTSPDFPSGTWILTSINRNGTIVLRKGAGALITTGTASTTEAILAMGFDLLFGASQFSIYYGQVTTSDADSGGSKVYVEYSQDGGGTWTLLVPSSMKYTTDLTNESTWTSVTPLVGDPGALVVEAISGGTSAPGRQRRYFAEYENLGIEGNVRFRVRKPTGTASRIMMDHIFVKPHE